MTIHFPCLAMICLAATVLSLNSCTEREVLYTETSWSTTEEAGWGGAGAVGKGQQKNSGLFGKKEAPAEKRRMEQIFDTATNAQKTLAATVSGDENSGEVMRPSYSDRRFESRGFDGRMSYDGKTRSDSSLNKSFSGLRNFTRQAFDSGSPARESGAMASANRQYARRPQTYPTGGRDSAEVTHLPSLSRESGQAMPFYNGRDARETNATVIRPRGTYAPNDAERRAPMSIDDVRKMLHPGQYSGDS